MKASTWLPVLQILAPGQMLSGAAMGAALGLTRAAIWQRIQYLRGLGLPIDSSESGYQLLGGAYLPDAAAIQPLLTLPLTCVAELDSTNTDVLSSAPRERILMAHYQRLGRGRRGRSWMGAPGRTLMLSVGMSLPLPVARLAGLSIAVGVALCELFQTMGAPVQLKWPNDLWIHEQKLAGFLMEVQGGVHDSVFVVVGLGLNIKPVGSPDVNAVSTEEALDRAWTDMDTGQVIVAIERVMRGFVDHEPAQLVEAFGRVSALTGRPVVVSEGSRTYRGMMAGIDEDGGMLLMTEGGLVTLMAGDVSLRPDT